MRIFDSYEAERGRNKMNTGLFWEYRMEDFDWQKYRKTVVERVISMGRLSDWYAAFDLYGGIRGVRKIARDEVVDLSPRDFDFMCKALNIKKEDTRCYKQAQLRAAHLIYHPFPWLESAVEEDGMRIASIADVAAMKVHAIINSGKRPKDFVDMAFLSMHYSYNEIKQLLLRRYPAYDPIMVDKAIIYFGDIDEGLIPSIKMLGYQFDFERIKNRIVKMTDSPDRVYSTPPLKMVKG